MHAIKLCRDLNAPPLFMRTMGDAIASILFEWSELPSELRGKHYDSFYEARVTPFPISEVLHEENWPIIPLERLLGLDAALTNVALAEGCTGSNNTRYARGCRFILAHARSHGWTCAALTRLESWEAIIAALNGAERGLLRMIEDLGMHKTPDQTTEGDLEAARQRAVANGLGECTSEKYVGQFRSVMRTTKLEAKLPLLDLKFKRPTFYLDPIEEMADEAQAELGTLETFLSQTWVPGRKARDATRVEFAKKTVSRFRQLHAWVRTHLGLKPPTLRALVTPEYVLPWIDWLQNERHLLREGIRNAVGPIHSIACKHEIFEGLNFEWMLDSIRKAPNERSYKRKMRKQEQAVTYGVVDQLPGMLRTQTAAPGLTAVEIARLRHDEELIKLLLLALRQRNIRECALSGNLVWDKITPKMAHDLDLPDCVRAEWDNGRHRDFLMLVYTESQTKADRAETVVLPLAHAESIWEFVQIYRRHLVPEDRDHSQVFCNLRGGQLSEQALRNLVRRLTLSHLGKGISPHLWRSIFGSHLLLLAALGIGRGLRHAQRALFHEIQDTETTQTYLNLDYALPGIAAMDREFASRAIAID